MSIKMETEHKNYRIALITAYGDCGGIETVVKKTVNILSSNYDIRHFHIYGEASDSKLSSIRDIYKVFDNYDIVHNHLFRLRYIVLFYFFSAVTRTCLYTTIHSTFGLVENEKLSPFKEKKKKLFCVKLFSLLMPSLFGNNLSFVSETVKRTFLKHFNIGKATARVIYNPIDITCNSSHLLKDRNVSFIGRLAKEKNPELAIKCFLKFKKTLSDIHNAKFNIYGDGPLYEPLSEKYSGDSSVIFHGWCEINDEVWSGVSALILTSDYEGHPLVAMQAIEKGIPVICSNIPALSELKTFFPDCIYIADNNTEEELACLVIEALSSVRERDIYKNIFSLLFSDEIYMNKMTELYSLCKKRLFCITKQIK